MSSTTYKAGQIAAVPGANVTLDAGRARAAASPVAGIKLVPSQTGIWVAICAISMSFAALTSALVVRQGSGMDWQRFVLPPILYVNTAILLASSFTLEISRKRIAAVAADADPERRSYAPAMKWLVATLLLGLVFVVGQVIAWRSLAAQGVFLATNPASSFFYVFTALHGLHVLGGIAGLLYAMRRLFLTIRTAKPVALGAAAVYWHFMDILWIYLLFIIAIRM
jgi:cytochrome c oxidase subunit 3